MSEARYLELQLEEIGGPVVDKLLGKADVNTDSIKGGNSSHVAATVLLNDLSELCTQYCALSTS
jgi:hypothetical protein